jgi:hypothetical protein
MEALHDKSPQRGEVCILEAFLLWIANSVGSPGVALTPTSYLDNLFYTHPDADQFQHACVHLKYFLRGAAMMHCMKHISCKRQGAWCKKWFAALPPHTCIDADTLTGFPLPQMTLSYRGHGWFTKSAWPHFSQELPPRPITSG